MVWAFSDDFYQQELIIGVMSIGICPPVSDSGVGHNIRLCSLVQMTMLSIALQTAVAVVRCI